MKRSSQMLDSSHAPNTSTENSPPKKLPDSSSPQKNLPGQPWVQRQGQSPQVYQPTNKGETVSVTARIIRDGSEGVKPYQSEFGDISLYQSPLIVEREGQNVDPNLPKRSIKTADSKSPEREPRFSFSSRRTAHLGFIYQQNCQSLMLCRKQIPKSMSDNSSLNDDQSKPSRAGRLMKRVSNLAVMRRNQKSSSSIKSPGSVTNLAYQPNQHQPATIEERIEPEYRPLRLRITSPRRRYRRRERPIPRIAALETPLHPH